MTDCREQCWLFQDLGDRKVEVDFGGGYLSSDWGGLILRELERQSGLLRDFAGCFVDNRDQRYIEHSVQELISQRIHGLVLGYEDLNDHDHLRLDPIHANTVNDQACNRVKELFHWQQYRRRPDSKCLGRRAVGQ